MALDTRSSSGGFGAGFVDDVDVAGVDDDVLVMANLR